MGDTVMAPRQPENLDRHWPPRFEGLVAQLPHLLNDLLACPPHFAGERPVAPRVSGVYLFSEGGRPRYVGRTRDCRRRLGDHIRPSSPQNSAPFAFNLARRELDEAGQLTMGTRAAIAAHDAFSDEFAKAKQRIRRMEFRFVAISDPAVSTIFEVYASIALGTEGDYNLFETH